MKRLSEKLGYKSTSAAILVGVVLLVAVLNLALYGVVDGYRLYLYAETKYEHTLSEGAEDFLGDLRGEGHEVKIRFCMAEQDLSADPIYSLVWNTASQLSQKFDFIKVDCINLLTHPDDAAKYLYKEEINPETGLPEQVQVANLSRQSVIVDGGKQHVLQSLASFFVLDDKEMITAYRGEEVMTAAVRYVVTENHPKAYYTTSHGEKLSLPLLQLLVSAGYEVTPIDLLKDTPTDTNGLLLIATPAYDFVKGGEGVRGEIEKMEEFMENGGLVVACLDPLSANTKELEALFSRWGIGVTHETVKDNNLSTDTDGYSLVTEYAQNEEATALKQAVYRNGAARVILKEASSLTVSAAEGKTTAPLLLSSSSSKTYKADKITSGEGRFPLSAVSIDTASGGGVLVTASYYLGANDALESNEYGNSDFLFAVMARYGERPVPLSATRLRIDNRRLEDLSMGEARVYTVLLVGVLPLAVALTGVAVLLRRRNGRRKA